ncbi:hypothetical protein J6590_102130 [Homalodisca vitripennis]|nr:hypothetical protein J6590_102130 [Homalodisca vitripennis]
MYLQQPASARLNMQTARLSKAKLLFTLVSTLKIKLLSDCKKLENFVNYTDSSLSAKLKDNTSSVNSRDSRSSTGQRSTYLARGVLAREPGSTRLEMDQIRQCMDNKEPSRVKFRRAEPDPPLLAVGLGSARLEYQFASVWRITDRTRAPTIEKSVHSVFTTVGQTLRTTRSAKGRAIYPAALQLSNSSDTLSDTCTDIVLL